MGVLGLWPFLSGDAVDSVLPFSEGAGHSLYLRTAAISKKTRKRRKDGRETTREAANSHRGVQQLRRLGIGFRLVNSADGTVTSCSRKPPPPLCRRES
uniref:Uncharacterized protein n=1 Tax=Chromera velia CCMP2878 TaxID=1169474 RepID=A0A0G4HS20_9ALVE|eukprot:Cvel_1305.t1-p1 / transcript=Cvel_1305.t1 / gene=Cvel_1305 / organism=Chromera_velia_CCMP2878 / gene_product=hypothetical protein / transcript_product=hypothetical protein / location=Cvel_scaffold44:99101-99996(-) / protein_length=97 / sequence_SO=supercontig / SO=protein_coding / is_pseudo=false